MTSSPRDIAALQGEVKSTWQRFLDSVEPQRGELYRYCRHLTRTPWDAEDLVQETLTRAFATLGTVFGQLPNPRAWLFRVASNLWIDRARKARHELALEAEAQAPAASADAQSSREAAGTLLVRLAPQERAAVVLKDVFDLSLEEIADALATTPGAVKTALHRGRGKLVAASAEPPSRAPAPGVLDAFCAAFNARDVNRLTELLLESATVEIVGVVTEYGKDAPKDPYTGSFASSVGPITFDERGGVAAELLEDYLGGLARCAVHPYRDSSILLFWFDHRTGPSVRCVMTLETEGDRIARVRNYFFTPDVIAETCEELGVPYRINGYRYW